jgi:hypothetical protein
MHCEALDAHREGRLVDAVQLGVAATESVFTVSERWDDFPYLWNAAARVAVEARDEPAYRHLVELAGTEEGRVPVPLRGHVARMRALWTWAGGGATDVEDLLHEAIGHYEHWGSRVCRASTQADLALWLLEQDRHGEAAVPLEAARATYLDLGANSWLQELDVRAAPYRTAEAAR